MSRSDGSTADYYELPEGATQLQDLISHRNLNAQLGEIFRACYRFGMADHSDQLRDAKKILFYAKAEVERLEKLLARAKVDFGIEVRGANRNFEPAQMIDDDSPRAQILGQNGEMAELIYPEIYKKSNFDGAPIWANYYVGPKEGKEGGYAWAESFENGAKARRIEDTFNFKLALDENSNWRIIEARPCQ